MYAVVKLEMHGPWNYKLAKGPKIIDLGPPAIILGPLP